MYIYSVYLNWKKFSKTIGGKNERKIFRWNENILENEITCLLINGDRRNHRNRSNTRGERDGEIRESWISASCLRPPLLHALWKKTRLLYASHTCLPFSPPCLCPFCRLLCMHLSRLSTSFLFFSFFFSLFLFAHSRGEFSHLEADIIGGASTV